MCEDGSMPKDSDPLSAEEIARIKKWINTGAILDAGISSSAELITVIPKEPQPTPPNLTVSPYRSQHSHFLPMENKSQVQDITKS